MRTQISRLDSSFPSIIPADGISTSVRTDISRAFSWNVLHAVIPIHRLCISMGNATLPLTQ
jgi:hypothetical protein